MARVTVTFEVPTVEEATALERGIIQTLSARSPGGGGRPAPWIPGAVLRDVTEWSVDIDAEDDDPRPGHPEIVGDTLIADGPGNDWGS